MMVIAHNEKTVIDVHAEAEDHYIGTKNKDRVLRRYDKETLEPSDE